VLKERMEFAATNRLGYSPSTPIPSPSPSTPIPSSSSPSTPIPSSSPSTPIPSSSPSIPIPSSSPSIPIPSSSPPSSSIHAIFCPSCSSLNVFLGIAKMTVLSCV
jgi:hypothetical protein